MRLIIVKSLAILILLGLGACNLPAASTEALMPTSATVFAPAIGAQEPTAPPPMEIPTQPPAIETPFTPPTPNAPPPSPQPVDAPTLEPTAALPDKPAGPQLGFLQDKNLWLLDAPGASAYQATTTGDIMGFAWSPDGEKIAVYRGEQVCLLRRDAAPTGECVNLGLEAPASQIERRLVWSPDQKMIALWNPSNPWDEDALGWLIVSLETKQVSFRIQDPVDWGASLAPNNEPGGITGEALFLADGSLVGTLTHRLLCGQGGCHYQLFTFDLVKGGFQPYPNKPEEGWSEGQHLLLSHDAKNLLNYGVFLIDCKSFVTFVDLFDLANQTRRTWNLDGQAVSTLALNPATGQSILARTSACPAAAPETPVWAQNCGLTQGFDVYPMQWWQADDVFIDLPPGLAPVWSPDGQTLAFRSCLSQGADGKWNPDQAVPAALYIWDAAGGTITPVAAGVQPQWRP